MPSFDLITDQDLEAFAAAVKRNGWRSSHFELEEDVFDQRKAEVEARLGQIGVACLATQVVVIYAVGDGSDWVAEFTADLEHQKFGEPSER